MVARLARDAQASTLPLARLVAGARPESWDAAFDVLAAALPADRASVLVIDLLETTGLSVDDFAGRVGFATGTSPREHLHAAIGVSPMAYRRTFRGAAAPAR